MGRTGGPFFDQQADEWGRTQVRLFDSYGPDPTEGARGHKQLLNATKAWADKRTQRGSHTAVTCTKLRTQHDNYQCGVWTAIMVEAWLGWTKSPEKSNWPRAAHQAAGGTGKAENTRVV
ncbi:hypothetical protein CYMTET_39972 [Cymbomonas tetramitiformis]|uniref:Uncharacterized protein n=1 Tax=Cymbomonas tetramitiformis TaxID=36881 RepID=A0AAE0C925_9CHLO|nr:hypothetical protein CYMTET_39972 [Cymbomonas tetramitiformis]